MTQTKTVTFNNVSMLGIQTESGKIFTSVKRICEDLGIDFSGQLQRIKKDEVLIRGVEFISIPSNSGLQDVFCIDIEYLPLWLTKIKPSKCKEEVRPLLIDFQLKAKDILAQAFLNNEKTSNGPNFEIPKTLGDALLLAGKLAKENEETFKRLQIAEPKALLLDVLTNTTELKTVKQLGYKLKPFGLGPLKIFELLRNEKIITKVNGENYPTHAYTNYFVTDAVTKAWQDSKTGNIKNKTFDILKVKSEFYPVLAQVLIKNKILTSDQFNEIDFNNVPADSSIDNQIFY